MMALPAIGDQPDLAGSDKIFREREAQRRLMDMIRAKGYSPSRMGQMKNVTPYESFEDMLLRLMKEGKFNNVGAGRNRA